MNIILLGPQGSGKGTQAQLLNEKYGWNHLSTGDIYRKGIQNKEPEFLRMKEHVDGGELIPDEFILRIVKKNIDDKGNIFDGFPRTLQQAEMLDELAEINLVVELKMPDELAVKRLSARKQCKDCREVYGKENPPRKEKCNKCGGQLFQREDDKPEAIKKRLALYHDETEPLLEYYNPRKITYTVDSSKSITQVFESICRLIAKHIND